MSKQWFDSYETQRLCQTLNELLQRDTAEVYESKSLEDLARHRAIRDTLTQAIGEIDRLAKQ